MIFDRLFFYLFVYFFLFIESLSLNTASWNASVDLQAQDRAFRIGQTKDCKIFRFISSGTVEEAQYQRQIYKQQMHSISLEGKKERRLFTGVQGVQGQEGELFGISNLLRQSSNMESIIKRNKSLEDSWSKETSIEIDKTQVDDTESNNTTIVPSDNPDGNITLELLKPSGIAIFPLAIFQLVQNLYIINIHSI